MLKPNADFAPEPLGGATGSVCVRPFLLFARSSASSLRPGSLPFFHMPAKQYVQPIFGGLIILLGDFSLQAVRLQVKQFFLERFQH